MCMNKQSPVIGPNSRWIWERPKAVPSKTEPPLSAQTASMFSTAKRTTCENNVSAPTLRANSAKSKTHLESNWWWARECCAKALREGTSRFFGGFLGLDEEGGASSSPNQHASGVSGSSVESCDWSSDSSSDATDVSYVDDESPDDAAIPSAAVENKTSSSSCIPSPSSARETRSTDGRVNARVANTCISPMCTAVMRRTPFTELERRGGDVLLCLHASCRYVEHVQIAAVRHERASSFAHTERGHGAA